MLGLLLINKPAGITSFGAVARIKRLTKEKRVGHTGTLDPMATGVLPILVGRATVLSSYLLNADKEYIAGVKLGITTDTLDITGNVTDRKQPCVSYKKVTDTVMSFVGKQTQVPPMFSALKMGGERLYDIARRGESADIPAREIEIFDIELLSGLENGDSFSFKTTVSKGTYIRSLVRDIGEKLGCGATLTSLERTKTGGFDILKCVPLDELIEENIGRYILSADSAVPHLKGINITEKQAVRFSNGGRLSLDRIKDFSAQNGEVIKVYCNNLFLGLGETDTVTNELKIKCLV